MRVELIEPRRIRYPIGAYGWIDLRIVTDGFLERLGRDAALTYLFFCAVGDRQGLSFWGRSRMARVLGMEPPAIQSALDKLVSADLVAATNRVVQVLPVPDHAPEPAVGGETPSGRPIRTSRAGQTAGSTPSEPDIDQDEIHAHEVEARAHIARFLGRKEPSAAAIRGVARGLALEARLAATPASARVVRGDRRG